MLIGIFGFYIQIFTLYEIDIRPWIYIFSKKPKLGTISQKEDMELVHSLWTPEEESLP